MGQVALAFPLATVAAGFPSPAEDYVEECLDLNQLCITNPAATFFVRVAGYSMVDAHIYPDDILIVDRSVEPRSGHIVIAALQGEFTVKRLKREGSVYWLVSESYQMINIRLQPADDTYLWGVVTHMIHKAR